jgi:hypothetical protein
MHARAMSFEELWLLIGEVSTPVSFTGETPVPPSLQRRGSARVPGTAPALGCTSTRPRGLIGKDCGRRPVASSTSRARGAPGGTANTEGGKERGMVVSTVQAQGVAGHRGGCHAVVFHCWASGSQPTDGQALLKGGAFLGTLRSSSARETCRAKPTGRWRSRVAR